MTPIPPSKDQPLNILSLTARIRRGMGDYSHHLGLFSRNARLYLLGSFLMGVNFQVFMLLLNLLLKEIGYVEGDIGLVASSRAVGMSVIAIPAGILLSRVRLKPILIGSCVLFAFFSYFIASSQQLYLLLGFSMLSGMAFSFYRVAAGPFYMRNSTSTERTYLFSVSFGTNMMAGMIGAAGAGRLAAEIGERTGDMIWGYQCTLYIGIGISLLALIPFLLIKSAAPSKEENRITLTWTQFRKRGRFYGKVFITNFMIGMGAGLIIPFLNLYFRDRFNLAPDTIGLYYSIVHGSMLIGTLAGPVLVKRLGLVRTVVISQILSIPFMAILSYAYWLPLAFVAFVLRGGLMNLGVPLVTNLGMELAEKEEQGFIGALLMVGWTSSWMVSTAVGGSLIEHYGYTFTMNLTIVVYLLSTAIFFIMFRRAEVKNGNGRGWQYAHEVSE